MKKSNEEVVKKPCMEKDWSTIWNNLLTAVLRFFFTFFNTSMGIFVSSTALVALETVTINHIYIYELIIIPTKH